MTHSDTDPAVNPEPRLLVNSPGLTAGGFSDKLRVLDLFSGIGGFSLGLERTGGFETVAFCEIEPFPRRVLAKHWPGTPIHRDVRELRGDDVGPVDVICGGYPCQPFSTAGKRRGAEDDRHLWPEYRRLISELRPTWVIGENVAGHISMGLDDVLSDLEALGYACRAFIVPACAVGAPHRRDRVWIVGHSDSHGKPVGPQHGEAPVVPSLAEPTTHPESEQSGRLLIARLQPDTPTGRADAANTYGNDAQGQQSGGFDAQERSLARAGPAGSHHASNGWFILTEPPVRGANDGVPAGLDTSRLKALGNAVVPQIPELIGRAILQARQAQ
jgi:DNA (cytosine-5)-methyltransferase 1